jgi:hypothetical protein
MKKLLLSLCLLVPALASTLSSQAAQVSSVRFLMRYDSVFCRYDVLMYLETGNIQAGGDQGANTNQITIVVPTGSNVGGNGGLFFIPATVTSNEPKFGALNGLTNVVTRGAIPAPWANPNRLVAPAALPSSDVYSFVVSPSSAWWPAANQGDTILLFSLTIVPPGPPSCGQGIRIWNNNVIKGSSVSGGDPSSSASGFGGSDYNNGIYIGNNTNQIFNGAFNPTDMSEAKPVVTDTVIVTGIGASRVINGTSSAPNGSCYTISSYAWTGPNSFSASTQNFTRSGGNSANYGVYTVTVTNSLGCSTARSVNILPVLPVHLLRFEGSAQGCMARLTWEVAPGQLDLNDVEVQYSPDGSRFETIGHLERNPDGSDLYSYSYPQAAGKGYYRLMIIEHSGATEYSKTVSVTTACASAPITIAPNPTRGQAVVSGIEAGDQVKVSDVLGNVIANYISAGSAATIDLAIYPAGIYSVIISRNNQILKTDKITKQ